MKHHLKYWAAAAAALLLTVSACNKKEENVKPNTEAQTEQAQAKQEVALDQLDRLDFNRAAVRLNLPVFWISEETPSKTLRPEALAALNFYPGSDSFTWKDDSGNFTPEFLDTYKRMVEVMKDPLLGKKIEDEKERARLEKVAEELDQGAATLVASDFSKSPEDEKNFVRAMLKAGKAIDALYTRQSGLDKALALIPEDDVLSRSMARRNWGIEAGSPKMKDDPACRAIATDAKIPVGVYPEELQKEDNFCAKLDAQPNAQELLTPFTAVVKDGDAFKAVPYPEYFKDEMKAVSDALKEAADALENNPKEEALRKYLTAAAEAFTTNNWDPADEAWAAMNSTNSAWYVRCAPDETYWEPCSRKAGFHLTFARINPDALQWQEKISPIQQDMEEQIAKIAGAPYEKRTVSFHLPDFIDIVTNSGDDRDGFGATIGQSLPNWGPVANEGRGRTVAMSNLYTDADTLKERVALASSFFTAADISHLNAGAMPELLSTIIHEAAHNLGPAHEYKVNGKVDDEIFGGNLASMAEEFKAQTAALWYLPYLVQKNVITQEMADNSYAYAIYWAFGHIARGMKTASGQIQPYSQLAAIQVGMLMEDGALTFDPEAMAANGTDKGAFTVHYDKMPESVNRIMTAIAQIKAKGDKDALLKLQQQHVDNSQVPIALIRERMLRMPKTSFVYSVKL